MKIAYNPITEAALTVAPNNNDITFDLKGLNIFTKGVKFKGTDTTYNVFKKHTSSGSGGYNGLVPVPSYTTTNNRYLREDGSWLPLINDIGNIPWDKISNKPTITLTTAVLAGKIDLDTIKNDNTINLPVNSVLDTFITYGGKNSLGNINPINLGIGFGGLNRLAGLPAHCVIIEYSTDGGETWQDYPTSSGYNKFKFVSNYGHAFYLGGSSTLDNPDLGKLRVTIVGDNSYIYCLVRKWMIEVSTNGAQNTVVDVEYLEANKEEWTNPNVRCFLQGWSGWNSIDAFHYYTIGGTGYLTKSWRFTFSLTRGSGNYVNKSMSVSNLTAHASHAWITPSTMAKYGHLYTWDNKLNAFFPATVKAKLFDGPVHTLTIQRNGAALDKFDGSMDKTVNIIVPTLASDIGAAPSSHNHNTSQINSLTGYSIATVRNKLLVTDTLNTALGKLELKSNLGATAYDIVQAAYDGDGTIENLQEILKVLLGIKDTDTIQGLLGKYLPLTGGTLSGRLTILGAAADHNFVTRGIVGATLDGVISDLYLQYGANCKIYLGNTAEHTISANGDYYTGRSKSSDILYGIYTSGGGKQPPSYFGRHAVGALMSNESVNSNTLYKNWIYLDCYGSDDVGGTTAIGVNRLSLGLYIMRSDATRTAWNESAELIGTHNLTKYVPNPVDYYWANIKISATSSTATNPIFNVTTANLFKKVGSNDTMVLLGGGGHKAISDFSLSTHTHPYLPLSGGLMNHDALITRDASNNSWVTGRNYALLRITEFKGYTPILSQKTSIGTWDLGVYTNDLLYFSFVSDENYAKNNNVATTLITISPNGTIRADKFEKKGSSANYVLLGSGDHRAISDFMLKTDELSNNLTTITKSLLVTKEWMDTGIIYNNLPSSGTYIIQVSILNSGSVSDMWELYNSGIMSWYVKDTNDSETDEIILHRAGHAYGNTIYLRTAMLGRDKGGLKLLICANKDMSAAFTYTFKFKRII